MVDQEPEYIHQNIDWLNLSQLFFIIAVVFLDESENKKQLSLLEKVLETLLSSFVIPVRYFVFNIAHLDFVFQMLAYLYIYMFRCFLM